jgi:hypothetical protein
LPRFQHHRSGETTGDPLDYAIVGQVDGVDRVTNLPGLVHELTVELKTWAAAAIELYGRGHGSSESQSVLEDRIQDRASEFKTVDVAHSRFGTRVRHRDEGLQFVLYRRTNIDQDEFLPDGGRTQTSRQSTDN